MRFRLGNEIKKGKYWEEEDKRVYKLCGRDGDVKTCVEEMQRMKEEGGGWEWVLGKRERVRDGQKKQKWKERKKREETRMRRKRRERGSGEREREKEWEKGGNVGRTKDEK